MKRRTLDIAFSLGGALFSVLLLVLGLVLKDQADFAGEYVKDQLLAQKIDFPKAEDLKNGEEEKACLQEYAGTLLDSGKKAECFANNYIGLHMEHSAAGLTISDGTNFAGATYESLGGYQMGSLPAAVGAAQGELNAAVAATTDTAVTEAAAKLDDAIANSPDPAVSGALEKLGAAGTDEEKAAAKSALGKAVSGSWDRAIIAANGGLAKAEAASTDSAVTDALQKVDIANADLKAVSGLRTTLQTGDTLRGLLLTTYGFSIFGDKADLAASVCYVAFALLLLLSIFGIIHAFTSKKAGDTILVAEHH